MHFDDFVHSRFLLLLHVVNGVPFGKLALVGSSVGQLAESVLLELEGKSNELLC